MCACISFASCSLQERAIRFSPALSQDKDDALAALACDASTKLLFVFRRWLWAPACMRVARVGAVPLWWAASGPDDTPAVVVGIATGPPARDLDEMSVADAIQRGLEDLAMAVGVSVVTLRVRLSFSLFSYFYMRMRMCVCVTVYICVCVQSIMTPGQSNPRTPRVMDARQVCARR